MNRMVWLPAILCLDFSRFATASIRIATTDRPGTPIPWNIFCAQ